MYLLLAVALLAAAAFGATLGHRIGFARGHRAGLKKGHRAAIDEVMAYAEQLQAAYAHPAPELATPLPGPRRGDRRP